ncbi:WD40/YVTN/BNR-like repeat-containing protein [Streptomyces sp. NRRL F-5727]|uniref:WD40/YVTN/BNR-like repeat-containing protein n=1 Tax=Streptomyces sp. NRRL F-5727 TaxID=1463871 RepID=UPI000B1E58DD|nr:sialidase family protein [Streptomyces sp. NRRL F-5727]
MRVPVSRAPAPLRALVALLLAWLLAACTGGPAPGRSSERPAGDGVFGAPPRIADGAGLPGWASGLGFAADGSGFTLLAECVSDPARPANGFCRQRVAVLDPGAERWEQRASPLPELRGTEGVSAQLWVLGPGRALIEDGGGEKPLRDWFTADGGRSWRRVDPRPAGRTPEIPVGAVLTAECVDRAAPVEECPRERLTVISPRDGRRRELVAQPPLGAHPRPAAVAEPDGSWWVSGVVPGTERSAVAVSRDRGRSWSVSRLPSPVPAGTPAWHTSVVVGPDAVYAAELGELEGGEPVKNPLRALHRSLDGGRTWQRMWTTGPVKEPRSLEGLPVPGPGGRIELAAQWSGYRSLDGGRTFRELDDGSAYVRRTGVGLLREGSRCRYEVTRDGVRWSEFLLACGEEDGL